VDPSELLTNIELHINKIKEEAHSRKEIIDRIDRWLSACEEENWLEEYNQVNFPCRQIGLLEDVTEKFLPWF